MKVNYVESHIERLIKLDENLTLTDSSPCLITFSLFNNLTQSYTCTHVGQVSLHSIPLNPPSAIRKRNANTNTNTNTNNNNNNTIAFIRYNQVIEYISTFCVLNAIYGLRQIHY
ncbi:hypothetical protein GQX74_012250 [Glossina fuscipes]|nr:hypothetical protein GQX74_012250 [Glossina fuscipes]